MDISCSKIVDAPEPTCLAAEALITFLVFNFLCKVALSSLTKGERILQGTRVSGWILKSLLKPGLEIQSGSMTLVQSVLL